MADEQRVTDAPTFIVYENGEVVERSEVSNLINLILINSEMTESIWRLCFCYHVAIIAQACRLINFKVNKKNKL